MPSSQPNHFIFAAPADFISDCVREGGARLPDDRPLPSMKEGDRIAFEAPAPLPPGRSRFNCTLPDGAGGWYWFGRQFVTPGGRD